MAGFLTGGGGIGGWAADAALGPAGLLMGGAGSMFGGGPNFGPINDLISQRQAEINAFEQRLESARNNVLSNYQNLQSTTMARFMPMAEAQLAGRGLSVGSGAFASALAKEAVGLQGNYDAMNANMTEKNLYDVENERANLFGSRLGVANQQMMIPFEQKQQLLGAGLGILGMGAKAGMAAMMPSASGSGNSNYFADMLAGGRQRSWMGTSDYANSAYNE